MQGQSNLKNRFEFIKSNEASIAKIQEVRERCKELGAFLDTLPVCRETSLALTNLEQCAMWANRAICVTQDNDQKHAD